MIVSTSLPLRDILIALYTAACEYTEKQRHEEDVNEPVDLSLLESEIARFTGIDGKYDFHSDRSAPADNHSNVSDELEVEGPFFLGIYPINLKVNLNHLPYIDLSSFDRSYGEDGTGLRALKKAAADKGHTIEVVTGEEYRRRNSASAAQEARPARPKSESFWRRSTPSPLNTDSSIRRSTSATWLPPLGSPQKALSWAFSGRKSSASQSTSPTTVASPASPDSSEHGNTSAPATPMPRLNLKLV